MREQETEIFYPRSVAEWQEWLEENHSAKTSVWLVQYHKASGIPSISWSQAVDVALCFGWIDSKKVSIEKGKTRQFFSKRKAKSTWSKINKDKVAGLIEAGLMTQAGLDTVEIAQKNGSWTLLDEVEALMIPEDLERAF